MSEDYQQELLAAFDLTQDDDGSTIEAGVRRGDLRPGTDGRLEVADNILAATLYTCSVADGCVLVDGHPAPCRSTRTAPEHVPDDFDHAAAVQAIALSDVAARKIRSSKAVNTLAAYERDWDKWADWCTRNRVIALPATPEAVANYIAEAAEMVRPTGKPAYAPSTITRWVAAINSVHRAAGAPVPGHSETVKAALSGIRREAARPPRRMKALTLDPLRTVLTSIPLHGWPGGVHGRRDYALILIGMAGAFRRGELVGITTDRCDLDSEQGLLIRLHQSKGDQEARGMTKVIPYGANPSTCGPCAFVRWLRVLDAARTGERPQVMRAVLDEPDLEAHVCKTQHLPGWATDGSPHPVFVATHRHGDVHVDRPMSGQAVHQVVKRRLEAAGIDPGRWGAHSLRAGFITQSLRTGATYTSIMNQTGHQNPETVEVYSREHNPADNNSVTRLGL